MKKTMITSVLSTAIFSVPISAIADECSYSAFLYGEARNAIGTPIEHGTYRMIIDVNPISDSEPSLFAPGVNPTTTWDWDPTDLLLDMGRVGDDVDKGEWAGDIFASGKITDTQKSTYLIDSNDNLYLVWFDQQYGSNAPHAGTAYGYLYLGDFSFVPGGDVTFYPTSGGNASQVVVPEPAGLTALAIGALGLLRRRPKA